MTNLPMFSTPTCYTFLNLRSELYKISATAEEVGKSSLDTGASSGGVHVPTTTYLPVGTKQALFLPPPS